MKTTRPLDSFPLEQRVSYHMAHIARARQHLINGDWTPMQAARQHRYHRVQIKRLRRQASAA